MQIRGVTGTNKVHGFSSDLRLDKVTGPVDAETFSGRIHLASATWQQGQSVRAKTFSGDIEVRLPDSAAGTVEFDSFSGHVDSAVSLTVQNSRSARCARPSTTLRVAS